MKTLKDFKKQNIGNRRVSKLDEFKEEINQLYYQDNFRVEQIQEFLKLNNIEVSTRRIRQFLKLNQNLTKKFSLQNQKEVLASPTKNKKVSKSTEMFLNSLKKG